MLDNRYDKRPKLNYNFTSGKVGTEERVTASYKSKAPTRSSVPPRSNNPVNSSFSVSGKAGRELTSLKRDKVDAERMLAAALQQLEA